MTDAKVAAETAVKLREVLAAIDQGGLTASTNQRAYLAGAAHALEALSSKAPAPPSESQ